MENLEIYLIVAASLMLLSVLSSKLSDRFGIPTLFIFLGLGMLAGSDGVLGIYFDNALLAQSVGTLALIFILFAGGLETSWDAVKPVLKEGLLLSTVGVVLTAVLTATFAYMLLDFTPLEALLLGAIISSTDAAAVFAILRAKSISLKKRLSPLLELESGSNDPMAIFLTIAIIQIITLPQSLSPLEWIWEFLLQFILGGALGYIFGILLPKVLNKIHLSYYGLYAVLTIAWVLLLFGLSSILGGNGFLAVYIAGIFANTKEFIHKKNLIGFHEGLTWVMQITVFLTLGLLVFPSELPEVFWESIAISIWLAFVARPIGVFLTLIPSSLSYKEKGFVSWVGLRGAVPIILATYPFIEGLEISDTIFNIVFIIVLSSILIQGSTIPTVAKLLGVKEEEKEDNGDVLSSPLLNKFLKKLYVGAESKALGKSIAELQLPKDILVILAKREGVYFKPTGSTMLESGDLILVYYANEENLALIDDVFQ